MRRGWTLVDLVVVLALVGVVLAVALPPVARWQHRWRVRQARDDVIWLLAAARWRAQAAGRAVTVQVTPAVGRVEAQHDAWRVSRNLGAAYGVQLWANRVSLVFRPDGVAAGAANLTLVVSRGAVAESVRVSRLGRVR
jgi:type II secretory pathway pseudopilin PulG